MDHPLLDGLNPDEKRLGAGAEEPQLDCGHGCGVGFEQDVDGVPGRGEVWVWAENGFGGFPGNFFGGDPDNALIGEVPGGVLFDMEFAANHYVGLPRREGCRVFRF